MATPRHGSAPLAPPYEPDVAETLRAHDAARAWSR